MIVVSNFRLQELSDRCRATCDIKGEGFGPELYFDVHPSNIAAIDIAEPNWAAIALLYPAMLMRQDLVIEADLSPLLLTNLRNDFMALVHNYEPLAKPIKIDAGASNSPIYRNAGKGVATGLSFGVDSFSTFQRYTRPEVPTGVRLTSAAIFQVGAFGKTSDQSIRIDKVRKRCEDILTPLGMNVYSLTSNMDDVFRPAASHGPVDFRKTVGFRNAAAALLLQREIGLYLPSSNVEYGRATYGPWFTTESLDPAFQPLLNTEALQFQSGLAGTSRYDKIIEIADNPLAQQNLDVCVAPAKEKFIGGAARNNCSQCWKCAQTMLALESMGKLDAFDKVFDLAIYRKDRTRILRLAVTDARKKGAASASYSVIERAQQAGMTLPPPDSRPVKTAERMLRLIRNRVGRALKIARLKA